MAPARQLVERVQPARRRRPASRPAPPPISLSSGGGGCGHDVSVAKPRSYSSSLLADVGDVRHSAAATAHADAAALRVAAALKQHIASIASLPIGALASTTPAAAVTLLATTTPGPRPLSLPSLPSASATPATRSQRASTLQPSLLLASRRASIDDSRRFWLCRRWRLRAVHAAALESTAETARTSAARAAWRACWRLWARAGKGFRRLCDSAAYSHVAKLQRTWRRLRCCAKSARDASRASVHLQQNLLCSWQIAATRRMQAALQRHRAERRADASAVHHGFRALHQWCTSRAEEHSAAEAERVAALLSRRRPLFGRWLWYLASQEQLRRVRVARHSRAHTMYTRGGVRRALRGACYTWLRRLAEREVHERSIAATLARRTRGHIHGAFGAWRAAARRQHHLQGTRRGGRAWSVRQCTQLRTLLLWQRRASVRLRKSGALAAARRWCRQQAAQAAWAQWRLTWALGATAHERNCLLSSKARGLARSRAMEAWHADVQQKAATRRAYTLGMRHHICAIKGRVLRTLRPPRRHNGLAKWALSPSYSAVAMRVYTSLRSWAERARIAADAQSLAEHARRQLRARRAQRAWAAPRW